MCGTHSSCTHATRPLTSPRSAAQPVTAKEVVADLHICHEINEPQVDSEPPALLKSHEFFPSHLLPVHIANTRSSIVQYVRDSTACCSFMLIVSTWHLVTPFSDVDKKRTLVTSDQFCERLRQSLIAAILLQTSCIHSIGPC